MVLKQLSLTNYKNFESKELEFDKNINCLVGENGVGKTNILDAIYHLAFGKSYFNPIAIQNIKHNELFFAINGRFKKENDDLNVLVGLKKGQKKMIKLNGKPYDKFSDHIGSIPLVIISPSDKDLINEGSAVRRKFIDGVISQNDKSYLSYLLAYQKIIAQRNALLKYFMANQKYNQKGLEVYDEQLQEYGTKIFEARKDFLESFIPVFKKLYQTISQKKEDIHLNYKSDLFNNSILNLLKNNAQKDRVLQYTSVGIHKDDLEFLIDGHAIKKFGSQGQQKTFLIALKLAQFEILKNTTSVTPILLLDDIFDKLDDRRVTQLIRFVNEDTFGQIFISDTHAKRTEEIISKINQGYKMFTL